MEFRTEFDLPAPPEAVAALLADEAYVREKISEAGGQAREVLVMGGPGGPVRATARFTLPTDGIPEAYRTFVGPSLDVSQREDWAAPADDGARAGTLALDVAGAPVKVTARLSLVPAAGGRSTYRIEGEVRAGIPFFGKAIEKALVGSVDRAVAVERKVAERRLAGG